MTTGATIFSGGEGVGVGMRQAGITHLWGVEWDDAIAQVARDNGFHTITADVREVDIRKLERPDILHASPVCKNASVAKAGGKESPEDIETAHAVTRFVTILHPAIFTLENVWGYRNFVAFDVILKCLRDEGYRVDYWHLNAANYGVPQTRKRLILVARLDGKPHRPEPTHAKNPTGMFGLQKWVGWYEAIEDLIPTLPESHFAEWQLKRLPIGLDNNALVERHGAFNLQEKNEVRHFGEHEPTLTIRASNRANEMFSAFIVNTNMSGDGGDGMKTRDCSEPSFSAKPADDGRLRAFIVGEGSHPPVGNRKPVTVHEQEQPMMTVTESGEKLRAFIVGGANTSETQAAPGVGVSDDDEPTRCVASNAGQWKAFVMAGGDTWTEPVAQDEPIYTIGDSRANHPNRAFLVNESSTMEVVSEDMPAASQVSSPRNANQKAFVVDGKPANYAGELQVTVSDEPIVTLTASIEKHPYRAWLSQGRVVAMTPRCLARFQSFPDSYILPDNKKLACCVIGNAVPPLLYQRVIEAQLA